MIPSSLLKENNQNKEKLLFKKNKKKTLAIY